MTDTPKHECPYGGMGLYDAPCGEAGCLCDLCREDRADARTQKLVEAMGRLYFPWPYAQPCTVPTSPPYLPGHIWCWYCNKWVDAGHYHVTSTSDSSTVDPGMCQCSRCGAWFSGTHTCFTIDPSGTQVRSTP